MPTCGNCSRKNEKKLPSSISLPLRANDGGHKEHEAGEIIAAKLRHERIHAEVLFNSRSYYFPPINLITRQSYANVAI